MANTQRNDDPLLVSSRREAVLVGVTFVLAIGYSVTYCTLFGYRRSPESLEFVLGFPDWVFYGILCPWAVCTALACGFSYFIMRDHVLESDAGETDAELVEQESGGE